jgi:hypothetical protein
MLKIEIRIYTSAMTTGTGLRSTNLTGNFSKIGAFGRDVFRYWRSGQPAPASNEVVQKLYAFTDGRSNDLLFRLLESRRRQSSPDLQFAWSGAALEGNPGPADPTIHNAVRTLKQEGVVVLAPRLNKKALQSLYDLAVSSPLETMTFAPLPPGQTPGTQSTIPIAAKGSSNGIDPEHPSHSYYGVPRAVLLENPYLQSLLCDPYLLAVAARYLGVFPVVTKPDMWWDTDSLPEGLRPRPFHVDSGCLRWLKVGINLTDTTFETPHFVYVKGSHNPNPATRPLTRRLASRMNLSDREVHEVCPERVARVTAPAGSVTLADTRGIHKGELAKKGHRLVLYFGLEGSAFNNIDKPAPLNKVGPELGKAMSARPFSYQFFRQTS